MYVRYLKTILLHSLLTLPPGLSMTNAVEGLNVINDPKCNKVLKVITFCLKCNKLLRVITLSLLRPKHFKIF